MKDYSTYPITLQTSFAGLVHGHPGVEPVLCPSAPCEAAGLSSEMKTCWRYDDPNIPQLFWKTGMGWSWHGILTGSLFLRTTLLSQTLVSGPVVPYTQSDLAKTLQHHGEKAILQHGFIFTKLKTSLCLIEEELALPHSVMLPALRKQMQAQG